MKERNAGVPKGRALLLFVCAGVAAPALLADSDCSDDNVDGQGAVF